VGSAAVVAVGVRRKLVKIDKTDVPSYVARDGPSLAADAGRPASQGPW